ncbi:MAG: hypothetical protein ABIG40_03395 [Parcubacteria group bacterium]
MRKSITKSSRKIKYLFVARGPGETGQARSLANYIFFKGGEIRFALLQEKNLAFLKEDKNFKIFLTSTPEKLKILVDKEKPDVILLFNSKMWGSKNFLENPPFEKPKLTLAADSNWLFNENKYPNYNFIKWADGYLILFPQKIFNLGLKKNGGAFSVLSPILKRIIPVGFLPTYDKLNQKEILKIRKKYGIKKDEKFIFSYFSGFGAGHRIWAFYNLIKSIDKLIKKGEKIKILYTGSTDSLEKKIIKRNWLIIKSRLSSEEYFLTLASSDLVFQHQGMVTLCQAISANIPVIANVSLLKKEDLKKIHFWEVEPFVRAGLCLMFKKTTPIKTISQAIEGLLYKNNLRKQMVKKQKIFYQRGEPIVYKIISKMLEDK